MGVHKCTPIKKRVYIPLKTMKFVYGTLLLAALAAAEPVSLKERLQQGMNQLNALRESTREQFGEQITALETKWNEFKNDKDLAPEELLNSLKERIDSKKFNEMLEKIETERQVIKENAAERAEYLAEKIETAMAMLEEVNEKSRNKFLAIMNKAH